MGSRWWQVALASTLLTSAACGSESPGPVAGAPTTSAASSTAPSAATPHAPPSALMPALVGLPTAKAGLLLGQLESTAGLGLSSDWRPLTVRCGPRPGTVVQQDPAPGTPLGRRAVVHLRVATLDLDELRGPCEPTDGDLGPVAGSDAALARQFYRFAADPALGAPFAPGDVWAGIEDGPTGTHVSEASRDDPTAWQVDTGYAERSGPFSALDIVAASGGYFELHRGITPTCPSGRDDPPPELAGFRAISLTAPRDTVMSCLDWWGVSLFLDDDDLIRGVAIRLGSP